MDDHHLNTMLSWTGNLASLGAIVSTFVGLLPPLGAAVAIVWYAINIADSRPVQRWLRSRRAHKIAKLKAKLCELEAMQVLEPEKSED